MKANTPLAIVYVLFYNFVPAQFAIVKHAAATSQSELENKITYVYQNVDNLDSKQAELVNYHDKGWRRLKEITKKIKELRRRVKGLRKHTMVSSLSLDSKGKALEIGKLHALRDRAAEAARDFLSGSLINEMKARAHRSSNGAIRINHRFADFVHTQKESEARHQKAKALVVIQKEGHNSLLLKNFTLLNRTLEVVRDEISSVLDADLFSSPAHKPMSQTPGLVELNTKLDHLEEGDDALAEQMDRVKRNMKRKHMIQDSTETSLMQQTTNIKFMVNMIESLGTSRTQLRNNLVRLNETVNVKIVFYTKLSDKIHRCDDRQAKLAFRIGNITALQARNIADAKLFENITQSTDFNDNVEKIRNRISEVHHRVDKKRLMAKIKSMDANSNKNKANMLFDQSVLPLDEEEAKEDEEPDTKSKKTVYNVREIDNLLSGI